MSDMPKSPASVLHTLMDEALELNTFKYILRKLLVNSEEITTLFAKNVLCKQQGIKFEIY